MENAMPMYRVANSSKAPLKKELSTKQAVSGLSSRGTGTAEAPIKKELPTKQGTESAEKAEAAKAASVPIKKERPTKQGTESAGKAEAAKAASVPIKKELLTKLGTESAGKAEAAKAASVPIKKELPTKQGTDSAGKAEAAKAASAPMNKELPTKQGTASAGKAQAAKATSAPIKKELPTKQGTESAGKAEAAKAASVPIKKELRTKQGTESALAKELPTKQGTESAGKAEAAKVASAPIKKELPTKQGEESAGQAKAAKVASAPIKKELPTKQGTESAGKAEAAKVASAPIKKELPTKQGTESAGKAAASTATAAPIKKELEKKQRTESAGKAGAAKVDLAPIKKELATVSMKQQMMPSSKKSRSALHGGSAAKTEKAVKKAQKKKVGTDAEPAKRKRQKTSTVPGNSLGAPGITTSGYAQPGGFGDGSWGPAPALSSIKKRQRAAKTEADVIAKEASRNALHDDHDANQAAEEELFAQVPVPAAKRRRTRAGPGMCCGCGQKLPEGALAYDRSDREKGSAYCEPCSEQLRSQRSLVRIGDFAWCKDPQSRGADASAHWPAVCLHLVFSSKDEKKPYVVQLVRPNFPEQQIPAQRVRQRDVVPWEDAVLNASIERLAKGRKRKRAVDLAAALRLAGAAGANLTSAMTSLSTMRKCRPRCVKASDSLGARGVWWMSPLRPSRRAPAGPLKQRPKRMQGLDASEGRKRATSADLEILQRELDAASQYEKELQARHAPTTNELSGLLWLMQTGLKVSESLL
ncbi:unnamed protein product [Symbiodinium sp. CCMP2592]|nr:unnamed protein product [Symbiodinium sp. CCMP2592]